MSEVTILRSAHTCKEADTTHGELVERRGLHDIHIDVFAFRGEGEVEVDDLIRRIKKGLQLVELIEEVP